MRRVTDLRHDTCRWPTSTEAGIRFACSDPAENGRPYCTTHCAQAYRKAEPAERLAALVAPRSPAARRRAAA